MTENTCLELALEGERLCKGGDFKEGVNYFEAAIGVGSDDMKTLSAIYSQLGNAYFYLGQYNKAMEYHLKDLTVAKSLIDSVGEAKASGNLGNSLKMLGKFDEAIMYCKRHLDISKQLNDKVGEGRALYNLGNVYHTRGKHTAKLGHQDPGDFPDDVKQCLLDAVKYYEQNLELMVKLGDKSAQGRTCGNLGNTHYLLGNFAEAVTFHHQRLRIAIEFNDKHAQRRAHCNLGNAYIFLGRFEKSIEHYKETLQLAQQLGDLVIEAQACYSLGNTYTLLRDYKTAIEYHLRHLRIAQELRDRVGEGRACWSLGNALVAIGNPEEALSYANQHLKISQEVGDKDGELTAQISIADLTKLIEQKTNTDPNDDSAAMSIDGSPAQKSRGKRLSMENMELLKMTPDNKLDDLKCHKYISSRRSPGLARDLDVNRGIEANPSTGPTPNGPIPSTLPNQREVDNDNFLDLLLRFQSKRMDDQRCSFDPMDNKENQRPGQSSTKTSRSSSVRSHRQGNNVNGRTNISRSSSTATASVNANGNGTTAVPHPSTSSNPSNSSSSSSATSPNTEQVLRDELFDLIAGIQGRRMDEQRACLPPLRRSYTTNGPESLPGSNNHNNNHQQRQLVRMATAGGPNGIVNSVPRPSRQMSLGANVLPDDDFFEMLMRCQGSRLEDQRVSLPSLFASNTGLSQRRLSSGAYSDSKESEENVVRRCQLERPLSVGSANDSPSRTGSTVPDDDFFSLLLRFQAGRIDDQRSTFPQFLRHGSGIIAEEDEVIQHETDATGSRKTSNAANTENKEPQSSKSSTHSSNDRK